MDVEVDFAALREAAKAADEFGEVFAQIKLSKILADVDAATAGTWNAPDGATYVPAGPDGSYGFTDVAKDWDDARQAWAEDNGRFADALRLVVRRGDADDQEAKDKLDRVLSDLLD